MICFERTSVGLVLRPTTHSTQNLRGTIHRASVPPSCQSTEGSPSRPRQRTLERSRAAQLPWPWFIRRQILVRPGNSGRPKEPQLSGEEIEPRSIRVRDEGLLREVLHPKRPPCCSDPHAHSCRRRIAACCVLLHSARRTPRAALQRHRCGPRTVHRAPGSHASSGCSSSSATITSGTMPASSLHGPAHGSGETRESMSAAHTLVHSSL
jgi:hypothetical protein